jgi:subtilisin family serine protease
MTPHRTSSRPFTLLVVLLLAACACAARAATDAVPGEVIVKYRPGIAAARRASVLRALPGSSRLRSLDLIHAERVRVTGMTEAEAIARLQADPAVEYAEPNYLIHADAIPNDSLFTQLWNMHNTGQGGAFANDDIHATQAWDLYTGDPTLKIGVIDSGVDYNHPDLAANIWTNPGEIPGNGIDDDGNGYIDDVHGYDFVNNDGDPMDDYFHGTHVAGTIGAVGNNVTGIAGVTWRCQMVPIKFINNLGVGDEAAAIAALQYAITVGVRVTNNSWGNMPGGQALLDAINAAGAAGQLFVNAAGNNGWNLDFVPVYPTSYVTPYMITVAATDGRDLRPSWSNYGAATVNLGAPGLNVFSCKPGGLYQSLNGTSMAAPHVTGAVALAMGYFPHATPLQIRQLVLSNTDPVASMATSTISGGRLDVYKVLHAGDHVAPGRIANLAAAALDTATISLSWTATGDDTTSGTATRYELCVSTSPVDSTNFTASATDTLGAPLAAGSPEAGSAGGLAPATTYHLALRAVDDFGNPGPISNVATATTASARPLAVGEAPPARPALRLAASNPGAGAMRFTLALPAAGEVEASVYDLGGRRVRRLAAGSPAAGVHALAWDGRDEAGTRSGSGLYFVRASTPYGALVLRFAIVR